MTFSYEQLPHTFNVAQHFIENNLAAGRGSNVAFRCGDASYTYDQVYQYTRQAAGLIRDYGVDQEQRVAIVLSDSPELVFAFWGAIWAGCIPVPINTAYPPDDVAYIIGDSRARLLLTTADWADRLQLSNDRCPRHTLTVDGQPSFMSVLEQARAAPHPAPTCRDEPAFWLYTSGSTSRPKGVIHAHHDMVVCAELYAKEILSLSEDDVSYSVAKIPFAYGLGNSLYMPMAVGGSAILSDAASAFEIISDIRRYQPTVFFGIPATYASILAVAQISPLDCSSLRLCVSAAEQLPEALWYQFRQTYGLEICEGIGTTELLHIFLSNRPTSCRPGSSGKPVPGYGVRVVGPSGETLPSRQIGDLEVTGESLMLGYWNRYRETREALCGQTMRTGDKYIVDDDGFFHFMGRNDDLFKVNGQWVSPMEVEAILLEHAEVLNCAVISNQGDSQDLTTVTAYLTLKPHSAWRGELQDELRRLARRKLPHFKVPKEFRVVDAMPRTATGKVNRKLLRNLQEAERGS